MNPFSVIACISYGHSALEVSEALAGARAYAKDRSDTTIVIVDDCSGNPPVLSGMQTIETPFNGGYSAAVNFLSTAVAPSASRILLINPDARVGREVVDALLGSDDVAATIPTIRDGVKLENVRSVLTAGQVLRLFLWPRLGRQRQMRLDERAPGDFLLGRPWVPAGTVIVFDGELIRRVPLRDEMFWVEMSAWAQDLEKAGLRSTFRVLKAEATHLGDSTRAHASAVVDRSLIAARAAYVREFGSPWHRSVLRPVLFAGVALRVSTRRLPLKRARPMLRVAAGAVPWQESES